MKFTTKACKTVTGNQGRRPNQLVLVTLLLMLAAGSSVLRTISIRSHRTLSAENDRGMALDLPGWKKFKGSGVEIWLIFSCITLKCTPCGHLNQIRGFPTS